MSSQEKSNSLPPVSFEEFASTTYEQWKEEAISTLKGAPFAKKLLSKTYEDITLQPIYTPVDTENLSDPLTYPGYPNYLRHPNPAGYLSSPWLIAQATDSLSPKDANQIIQEELAKGSQVVNITLNRATLGCLESAERGVFVKDIADIGELLKGLDLNKLPLHIYTGASALPFLGLLLAWKNEKIDYSGCLGADPLGFLATEGKLPAPLSLLYDEMAAAIKWAKKEAPNLKTILVKGEVYHNAGANAVQEIAYSLATAIAYTEAMLERDLDINTVAAQIRFSLSLGADFFMEIAKLRAIRMAWSQVVAAFGGNAEAQKIDIFARTSSFTQTIYDPYVNLLRSTSQAFSGVLGGVSAIQVVPLDDPVRPGDATSRRIARNLQIMLQNEFNLLSPIDPGGGSWYIENLTSSLAEKGWALLQKTFANGGLWQSLKEDLIQKDLNEVLDRRLKNLALRTERIIGTNIYANPEEVPLAAVESSLPKNSTQSRNAPKNIDHDDDLIKNIIEAGRAKATISEIRLALNRGALDDTIITPLKAHRLTEEFESLRQKTENYSAQTGKQIKVFLANMGPIPQHKARADFSAGFMEVAGFSVIKNDGFLTIEEAAQAALNSEADVVVICSTDDTYPELVTPLTKRIKTAAPETIVCLAGMPAPEHKEAYLKAKVDDFIHLKADCYAALRKIQEAKGME